jgi:hypothetical protein
MANTNMASFALGLQRFRDRAENRRRQITKAVAMEGLNGLVMGTRFDTGRARGNWQAGETRPPEGDVDRLDKDGGTTIAAGNREIQGMGGDDIIWVHNGVPYISVLEGWDKMLAGTAERLRIWIRSMP